MPEPYDIADALSRIELTLIDSMKRNMQKHINDENIENIIWSQWQAEMLQGLQGYKKQLKDTSFNKINDEIDQVLLKAYQTGQSDQEIEILEALKKGAILPDSTRKGTISGQFFKVNESKMNALMDEVKNSMHAAENAMLRKAEDIYRQTIFKAQIYANTGAGTLWQSVDMATKDFLKQGINCVQFKNGATMNIASYSEMAIRTASSRASMYGSGAKRDEYGVHTVLVSSHDSACPACVEYQGKVYIDDVYSSGKHDGKYPLLSAAVNAGMFHPNCRNTVSTFFEGINTVPKQPTDEEKKEQLRRYYLEQEQRNCERNIRGYKRLQVGSTDAGNVEKYKQRFDYWVNRHNDLLRNNSDVLRAYPERLKIWGVTDVPKGSTGPKIPKATPILKDTKSASAAKTWHDYKYESTFRDKKSNEKILSDKYGIVLKDGRKYKIDERVLDENVQWLDKFHSFYPNFEEKNPVKIPQLVIQPPSKMHGGRTAGYYSYDRYKPKAYELALNGERMSNYTMLTDRMKQMANQQWFVQNANANSVFVHEYGHHIANSMRHITGKADFEDALLKECIDEFKKVEPTYTQNTYVGLGKHVSKYGTTSYSELFAESFAEYYGGDNPRLFARIFGKKLDAILKGV